MNVEGIHLGATAHPTKIQELLQPLLLRASAAQQKRIGENGMTSIKEVGGLKG